MESRIFKSETIDYTYLELEIEYNDGIPCGILYEVFDKESSEVFERTYLCEVYADTPSYDGNIDWYALEFLQGIFPNIQKL